MATASAAGQIESIDVDVARREVVLLDGRGWRWTFRNAPAFNLVRLERPNQGSVGTTLASAAASMGTTVRLLEQVLEASWNEALRTQPAPGPGLPIDPGIPLLPPDPGLPMPDFPDPPFPGPFPVLPPGDGTMEPILLSSLGPLVAVVIALATQLVRGPLTRGLILRWASLPGWARMVLTAAGFTAGADILFDMGPGDSGWIEVPNIFPGLPDIPGLPIGGGGGDPTTIMVEAMTVSTWNANGVLFHRLSDGRLAVRNKWGVWKIWRPKKPIVIMPSGPNNLNDVLRADAILQKQGKKITKLLRNRGWKVSRG